MTAPWRTFGASSTTDDVLAGVDLTGMSAIVTGASGGLGAETARALASKGCAVTLGARNVDKAAVVSTSIREEDPEALVEVRELELADPANVRDFVRQWTADHDALHLLILNAGVMACPLTRTTEGFELHFATNHLGHFQLTTSLLDPLRAGAPARVVSVSSGGHVLSPVVFDDLHYEHRAYDPWTAYGQSKTANVLFAVELDRRYRDAGVRAFAVHPGMIATDLSRHLTRESLAQIVDMAEGSGESYKSVAEGAATSVWAATAPELDGKGGVYLANCAVAPPIEEASPGYAAHAVDLDAARRLWEISTAAGEVMPQRS
jgi:NAD(P)-dependent dehydrogenase (short-subunit alcohol dehydrogenase family)